jgi:hypothetical protein
MCCQNPQPNDHRLISAIQATLREVLILCDDRRLLLNRVPPDFRVAGLSRSDLKSSSLTVRSWRLFRVVRIRRPRRKGRVYTNTKHNCPWKNRYLLAAPVHARALFSSAESAVGRTPKILGNWQTGFITTLSASHSSVHLTPPERSHPPWKGLACPKATREPR